MMNKPLILCAVSLVLSILFASCTKDTDDYKTPRFGKMSYEPSPAVPGQTLVITLAHVEQGNGIAGTDYSWTIKEVTHDAVTGNLKDTTISVHTNYDGYGKQDPILKFQLPEDCPAGRHQVRMHATFQGYIGNHLFDAATATDYITVK